MKKITFIGTLLFMFGIVYGQNTSNIKSLCEKSNTSNFHEDARQCNDIWIQANDLLVAVNDDFILNKITVPIWMDEGYVLTDFDVYYYDDNAGIPGNLLDSELNLSPTSQTVLESNYGYDIVEVVVDVTPFTFSGQIDTETTYWVGIHTNNAGTDPMYIHWETTTESMEGSPMAQGQIGGGAFTIPDGTKDGVYTFHGDCPSAGIEDSLKEDIKLYPNPVNNELFIDTNIKIDEIGIYTVLGNKVLTSFNRNINVKDLNPGVYVLKVKSNKKEASYKLIKN